MVTPRLNTRTIAKGLGVYVLFALLLPLIVTFLASFGPSELVAEFIAPAKRFQFLLVVIAGAGVAWLSRAHPVAHAVVVGFLGGLLTFCAVLALGAAPHLSLASAFAQYALMAVVWCCIGGFLGALLLRGRHAL